MKSRGVKNTASEGRARVMRRSAKRRACSSAEVAEKAFRQRYPDIPVDAALFRLVGVDPPLSLDAERTALREALIERFATT